MGGSGAERSRATTGQREGSESGRLRVLVLHPSRASGIALSVAGDGRPPCATAADEADTTAPSAVD